MGQQVGMVWQYNVRRISYNIQINLNQAKNTTLMADVIRVKAKKTFEWDQDSKYLFIKVPMPGHTSIKNLEIYLSDLILRITSKQKKSADTLDMGRQVDYLSADNKFVFIDGVVHATIKKKTPGEQWDSLLVEDISLAELKQRRKQSQARYQQNIKQVEENKQKLKTQHDRMATKELMRFEEEERKKLDKKKQEQKQAALHQVFRNINDKTGKIQYEGHKWNEKGEKDLQRLEREQQQERNRQKQQRRKQQQQKYLKQLNNQPDTKLPKTTKNTMFTEEDVKHFDELRNNVQQQIQQIPVRKQAKVNVKFTQKLYPNVATRDYHYAQPPMPKGSMPMPPPRQGDLESRNPLWLKDRGDAFMRHKNYSAALDAYNQAIKIDPSQRKILMNRSLANMKLFNLDAAIHDCDTILLQMQKQVVNNQQNKEQALLDLMKIKVRKALCLGWKGKLQQSKQILTQQLHVAQSPQTKQQIQQSLSLIVSRQQSHQVKLKGDQLFKRQQYEQALSYYNKSIGQDNNEYSLSNKCLCLNKLNRYEQSIRVSNKAIQTIQQFVAASNNNIVKNNPDCVTILMKLLYRKSNAQEQTNMLKEAQSTLRKALNINPQDRDIKHALNSLKSREAMEQYTTLKEQASLELTKNANAEQALKIYTRCLKLLQNQENVSEYLAILQNQCVCYLKLEQYDNIVSVCIRVLNIVNNLKSKVVQFGDKKNHNTTLTKPVLNKIAVRTLMRRANAYLRLGQVYNAKSDLEKAVELEPTDASVAKQLDKLKESIGAA